MRHAIPTRLVRMADATKRDRTAADDDGDGDEAAPGGCERLRANVVARFS